MPVRELLPGITFSSERLICQQGKYLFTKHLLFSPSYELLSSPLKSQASNPFLSSGWYISFSCLAAFGSHFFVGFPYIHN